MKQEKKIFIQDICVCWSDLYYYDDYFEEYEYANDVLLLKETNYNFSINKENKIKLYNNCLCEQIKYFVEPNGSIKKISYNEKYEIQWVPYLFSDIIKLNDLIKKFKTDERKDSSYREYILEIYKMITKTIENKDSIFIEELDNIIGAIYDLYVYVFEKITEEEYDKNYGPNHNVIDFKKYKTLLKKK